MKFYEAVNALFDGKIIKRDGWRGTSRLLVREGEIYHETDGSIGEYKFSCLDVCTEWELYEEPGLTFAQVIEGLKNRKRFRRRKWFNDLFYINWMTPEDLIVDSFGNEATLTICDFEATDWEESK